MRSKRQDVVIDNSDLTTKVYQWLKGAILHHEIRPGTKLDITELADRLGVSRTPVKDAVNRLAIEGLITLYSRRGTYVSTMSVQTYRDLMETRLMIEQWVATQLPVDQLRTFYPKARDLYRTMEQLIDVADATSFDYPEFLKIDLDLHTRIVSLSHNETIFEFYQSVMARSTIGRIYFQDQEESFRRSQLAHQEHGHILSAIEAGDPRMLLGALKDHLQASRDYTVVLLNRYPE